MSDNGYLGDLFLRLGIALGLGLLVGLQRQRAHADDVAGFRTFALVSLAGAVCGRLSIGFGGWVLAAALLALALLLVIGNYAKIRAGRIEPGLTTEVTALLMFLVGAFAAVGQPVVAVAVGGATAALLQWKEALHRLAARIGDDDLRAFMQFAVVTMVVLPVLPNRAMGPYHVLNPRQVWWMVVLVIGLSLLGYVGYELLGRRAGTLLAGVLGGMVSSTATTVSFARRVRTPAVAVQEAAAVVLLASAVVYVRVLVEIGVVSTVMLAAAAPPLILMLLLLALVAAAMARFETGGDHESPPHANPTELPTALVFGAAYALVLLAAAWASATLGGNGLVGVAAISGLVDVNAITLSTAQLVHAGRLQADFAWRLVLLASLSNILFKIVVVAVVGTPALLRKVALWWTVALVVGLAIAAAWPGPAALLALY